MAGIPQGALAAGPVKRSQSACEEPSGDLGERSGPLAVSDPHGPARAPLPGLIVLIDLHALKARARRAEESLTKTGLTPFPAEPGPRDQAPPAGAASVLTNLRAPWHGTGPGVFGEISDFPLKLLSVGSNRLQLAADDIDPAGPHLRPTPALAGSRCSRREMGTGRLPVGEKEPARFGGTW